MQNDLTNPGDLFKQAWVFFVAHWKLCVGIVVVPFFISALTQLLFAVKTPGTNMLGIVLFVVTVVLFVLMRIAMVQMIDIVSKDSQAIPTIRSTYGEAGQKFWSYVWVAIVSVFFLIGATAFSLIPVLVISGLIEILGAGVATPIVFSIAMLACVLVIAVYMTFSPFVFILGGKTGLSSVSESLALVRGRCWSVLWRIVCLVVIMFLVYLVLVGLVLLIAGIFGAIKTLPVALIASALLGIPFSAVITAVSVIYMYFLYQSLVATRVSFLKPLVSDKSLIGISIIGGIVLVITLMIPILGIGALSTARLMSKQSLAVPLQTP